ncbi:MAG: terminase large subunit [Bacteroides sp.]|nr:terminase large subunit [Eubacterium sp.]MCM1419293.1 terminase large subunit [Roseburia sp.]MCM1463419.1 terminase large subunit [Bacteroides sp.]
MKIPECIGEYIGIVRGGEYEVCEDQRLLCDMVERVFETEEIVFDEGQFEKYMSYQKYFPYSLFPWEKFCFALHNCLYKPGGQLRFPMLFIYVGRGAGKNGYLAFENFALLSPANGIPHYHIYTFATSEDQAKTSWEDVYNVLEANKTKLGHFFHWTKEKITCTKTGSSYLFCTSNPDTKDGGRPGKIDFDEYHAYKDYKLINVAVTGLGKRKNPRRTIITTDGLIRGGPLDDTLDRMNQVLAGEAEDNGWLPFLCHIEKEEEAKDPAKWHKANPSLRYLDDLLAETRIEYGDYLINPIENMSFIAKRMNYPPRHMDGEVTSWENILATDREVPDVTGRFCVGGVDFAKTTDFVGAGLLFNVDGEDVWITHSWICEQSEDLEKIKAPIREWEARGLLTIVNAPEIPPELVATWLATKAAELGATILKIGIDKYRYTLLRKALNDICFSAEKEVGNVRLLRPSNEMENIPMITAKFAGKKIVWGDNPLMRWYANNSKIDMTQSGNMTYQKIEPKSRKTDGFKAFVAAECISGELEQTGGAPVGEELSKVYIY